MATLEELVNKGNGPTVGSGASSEQIPMNEAEQIDYIPTGRGISFNWLWSDTGEGEVEDYINHPLNFSKSKGLAQMLRGFEGVFGSLRKAVIDIVVGGLQFAKERKG